MCDTREYQLSHEPYVLLTRLKEDDLVCSSHLRLSGQSNFRRRCLQLNEQPHKCIHCVKTFATRRELQRHRSDHQPKCDICDTKFHSFHYLQIHALIHSGEKLFKCNICYKEFIQRSNWRTHMRVHKTGSHYCNICHIKFPTEAILKRHNVLYHHSDGILNIKSTEEQSELLKCKPRSTKCEMRSKISKQAKRPHKNINHTCNLCGKLFLRKDNLEDHHLRQHNKKYKPNVCNFCGKSFVHPTELNTHIRFHTGEKPFKCKTCSKEFAQGAHLRIHLRIHTGEKIFKCNKCSKNFTRRAASENHKAWHIGKKTVACNVCHKCFFTQSDLKNHSRCHIEKKFKCNECNALFRSNTELRLHTAHAHSDERPYPCDVCKKAFKVKGKLTEHLRTHSNEGYHKCVHCEKRFKSEVHFNKHLKIHSIERS